MKNLTTFLLLLSLNMSWAQIQIGMENMQIYDSVNVSWQKQCHKISAASIKTIHIIRSYKKWQDTIIQHYKRDGTFEGSNYTFDTLNRLVTIDERKIEMNDTSGRATQITYADAEISIIRKNFHKGDTGHSLQASYFKYNDKGHLIYDSTFTNTYLSTHSQFETHHYTYTYDAFGRIKTRRIRSYPNTHLFLPEVLTYIYKNDTSIIRYKRRSSTWKNPRLLLYHDEIITQDTISNTWKKEYKSYDPITGKEYTFPNTGYYIYDAHNNLIEWKINTGVKFFVECTYDSIGNIRSEKRSEKRRGIFARKSHTSTYHYTFY